MSVSDIDPDFPDQRWSEHWRELRERGSQTFEGRHRSRAGRVYPVEISANYFEFDGRGYNLALVRDITERKQTEETLRKASRGIATSLTMLSTGSICSLSPGMAA